jgi:hypothetical protein
VGQDEKDNAGSEALKHPRFFIASICIVLYFSSNPE